MTRLIKEAIQHYLELSKEQSDNQAAYFAQMLAQIEAGDIVELNELEMTQVLSERDANREAALRNEIAERILEQVELVIAAGYENLTDEETESLLALQNFRQSGKGDLSELTLGDVAAVLRDRVLQQQTELKHRSREMLLILQTTRLSVTQAELQETVLEYNQATVALKALDTILQEHGTMFVNGGYIPIRLTTPEPPAPQPPEVAQRNLTLSEVTQYGIPYASLYTIVAQSGRMKLGVHYIEERKGSRTTRYITPEGMGWLHAHYHLATWEEKETRIQQLADHVQPPENDEDTEKNLDTAQPKDEIFSDEKVSPRLLGMKMLIEQTSEGLFRYQTLSQIVKELIPDEVDPELDKQNYKRMHWNLSDVREYVKDKLRQIPSDPGETTVAEAIEFYFTKKRSKTVSPEWKAFYDEVSEKFGRLTVDDFIKGVIHRFDLELAEGWQWIDDVVSRDDALFNYTFFVCTNHLCLGSEYRQVAGNIQLSKLGTDLLAALMKRLQTKPDKFDAEQIRAEVMENYEWQKRMEAQVNWNGNFLLGQFLLKSEIDQEGKKIPFTRVIEQFVLPYLSIKGQTFTSLTDWSRAHGILPEEYDDVIKWYEDKLMVPGKNRVRHQSTFDNDITYIVRDQIKKIIKNLNPKDLSLFDKVENDWVRLVLSTSDNFDMPAYKIYATLMTDIKTAFYSKRHVLGVEGMRDLSQFLMMIDTFFNDYVDFRGKRATNRSAGTTEQNNRF